jgi:hypothetical protein
LTDIALDKNNQLPDLPMGSGRMLAHVFSFVICGHANCPGMSIPCAGMHADPIGLLESGVCDTCRKERKWFLEQEQDQGGRQRALTAVEALAAFKDCAGCGRAAVPAGEPSCVANPRICSIHSADSYLLIFTWPADLLIGKLSFSRRKDFFGYANKEGRKLCHACFI